MKKHRIRVDLIVESPDLELSEHVVDEVLDSGVFQDAINEFESDDGSVTVLSALVAESSIERKSP